MANKCNALDYLLQTQIAVDISLCYGHKILPFAKRDTAEENVFGPSPSLASPYIYWVKNEIWLTSDWIPPIFLLTFYPWQRQVHVVVCVYKQCGAGLERITCKRVILVLIVSQLTEVLKQALRQNVAWLCPLGGWLEGRIINYLQTSVPNVHDFFLPAEKSKGLWVPYFLLHPL